MSKKESGPKKAIIVGATSGIGLEVARLLSKKGWQIGIAGRRKHLLDAIQKDLGQGCQTKVLDVIREDASTLLTEFIEEMGGMDLYIHCAGIGFNNQELEKWKEVDTIQTNALGFVRMMNAVFHYFCQKGEGRIAAITSIAGIRGLGAAPAYSASKRMQSTYLEALRQLSAIKRKDIHITDIKPGFVDTDLIKEGTYPMKMNAAFVAREVLWAISHNRRSIVVDWKFRIIVFFWKLIPTWLWVRLPIGRKQ